MSSPLIVVGIDPGLSGAIAVICQKKARVFAMPTFLNGYGKKEVDTAKLFYLLLEGVGGEPGQVVIEKVGGQPGWGSTASFAFGSAVGKAYAALEIGGWEPVEVRPVAWKKAVLGPGPKWSKDMAIAWVDKHYPGTNLLPRAGSRKKSHDWAEAVCLAHYGVLHANGSRTAR